MYQNKRVSSRIKNIKLVEDNVIEEALKLSKINYKKRNQELVEVKFICKHKGKCIIF